MGCLADWLKSNELVLNLKKSKTETLLFGTSQRIATQFELLKIKLSHEAVINNTSEYKYLGVRVNNSLNLNSNFNALYKKVSGRLRLLAKIRSYLDQAAAATIYHSLVLPAFTICGILHLNYTNTQLRRLLSLHSYPIKIVPRDVRLNQKLISVVDANKTRAWKLVPKCLDKETCEQLQNHFTLQEHERQTRHNNCTLKLPRIKTECGENHLCLRVQRCIMNYSWNFVKLRTIRNLRNSLKIILNDIYIKITSETLNVNNFFQLQICISTL